MDALVAIWTHSFFKHVGWGTAHIPPEPQSGIRSSSLYVPFSLCFPNGGSCFARVVKKLTPFESWLEKREQECGKGDTFRNQFKAKLSLTREEAVHPNRIHAARILSSGRFEVIIGLVTVANFGMILLDTDFAADGKDTPLWLQVGNVFVLALLAWQNIFL